MATQQDLINLNLASADLKARSYVVATKTVLAITRARLSVDQVDNTPDASKPVSAPQKTYIDAGDAQTLANGKTYADTIVANLGSGSTTALTDAITLLQAAIASNSTADQAYALTQAQAALSSANSAASTALTDAVSTLNAAITANGVADKAYADGVGTAAVTDAASAASAAVNAAVNSVNEAILANGVADKAYADGVSADAQAAAIASSSSALTSAVSTLNAAITASSVVDKAYADILLDTAMDTVASEISALSASATATFATLTALSTLTGTVSANDVAVRSQITTEVTSAQAAMTSYVDGLALGTVDLRDAFDPTLTSDIFPVTGGRGAAGAITKGDMWVIRLSTNGVTEHIFAGLGRATPGDFIIALVNNPTVASDWALIETPDSFASLPAEMVVALIDGTNDTSTSKVASVKAIVDYTASLYTPITYTNNLVAIISDLSTAVSDNTTAIAQLQAAMTA